MSTTTLPSGTIEIDRAAIGVDKMPTFVIGRELQLAVTARAILSD